MEEEGVKIRETDVHVIVQMDLRVQVAKKVVSIQNMRKSIQ
jgi:hypothetical protein